MTNCGPSNSPDKTDVPTAASATPPGYRVWLGAACAVMALALIIKPEVWQSGLTFGPQDNAQIAEAASWWNGRLDLAERTWDTALKDGRVYSHLPPLFSLIAAGLLAFTQTVPQWFIALAIALPVVLLSYFLFRLRTGSTLWGAVLAVGFVCGTSLYPAIDRALTYGTPYFINHILGTIGLLIVLIESFGRRRGSVTALGLLIGALSRQLTIVYAIPVIWAALQERNSRERKKRLILLGATLTVVIATYVTLNTVKFGSPVDSGYLHIYADRPEDALVRDAKTYGLFSAHFVPRNWYHMNVGLPELREVTDASGTWAYFWPNDKGTGIWWTTPLLIWCLVDLRKILMDPARRVWLGAACIVITVLLCFHNTGWEQLGFNRFSLDYLPVLMALSAPRCVAGRGRWLSAIMIAWSVYYFRFLI